MDFKTSQKLYSPARINKYAKWFEVIVNHAKMGSFPIAFEDFFQADEWLFTLSDDRLPYPPFTPSSIDEIPDDLMVDYAHLYFAQSSINELECVIGFKGFLRPNGHQIAEVIRHAVKENKGLISHVELGIEKKIDYSTEIIKEEKIEDGLRIQLKNGETIDLFDEIALYAWGENN